jgi:hypothetical protein
MDAIQVGAFIHKLQTEAQFFNESHKGHGFVITGNDRIFLNSVRKTSVNLSTCVYSTSFITLVGFNEWNRWLKGNKPVLKHHVIGTPETGGK